MIMAFRVLKNVKERILIEGLNIGANEGVYCITARKLAKKCDISTHTIYNYFPSMRSLIDEIAITFDRKYMDEILPLINNNASREDVFNYFLDAFIKERNSTLYYISYIHYYGFDPTSKNERADEFLVYAKMIFGDNLDNDTYLFLWDYITRVIFYYAEKILKGLLPDTKEFRKLAFDVVYNGVNNLINKEIKE